MKLSEAKNGEKVTVLALDGDSALQHRLSEMGFVAGREIEVIKNAPLSDPIEYRLMGYEISLRRSEAQNILVTREPGGF
ncbi:MAG: FeoA family protein, partial [Rikenellaceae bacterium]